jgi:putative membrane protein
VVSLGGLLPIDTAPGLLQALNQFLPIARAADAISHVTLGGRVGTVAPDVLVLLTWGAAALGVTVLAARRRQRVTVADVRQELQPA